MHGAHIWNGMSKMPMAESRFVRTPGPPKVKLTAPGKTISSTCRKPFLSRPKSTNAASRPGAEPAALVEAVREEPRLGRDRARHSGRVRPRDGVLDHVRDPVAILVREGDGRRMDGHPAPRQEEEGREEGPGEHDHDQSHERAAHQAGPDQRRSRGGQSRFPRSAHRGECSKGVKRVC